MLLRYRDLKKWRSQLLWPLRHRLPLIIVLAVFINSILYLLLGSFSAETVRRVEVVAADRIGPFVLGLGAADAADQSGP